MLGQSRPSLHRQSDGRPGVRPIHHWRCVGPLLNESSACVVGFLPDIQSHKTMTQRDFVRQVPNRLTGVIVGLVFYYNAEFLSNAAPSNWSNFVDQNMQLIGVLMIGLSVLKLSIDWYLVNTEDELEKKV